MENMVMKSFENFYNNRNVLITGHTGFKGSWLSLWLIELGANVSGYSIDYPSKPNLFQTLELENKLTHFIGDINNQTEFEETLKKSKPEIIFHLAAQSLVSESYKNPIQTFETNIIGTAKIIDACRKFSFVKAVIIVTSDKCYENNEWIYGYREIDPLGGADPYSASKGCAEIVTSSLQKSFFNLNNYNKTHSLLIASVRAGNVIGGGDWAENRLIPDCIRALSKNQEILLRNPRSVRPWQFVLEPLSGYMWVGKLLLMNEVKYSGAWNFGPLQEGIETVENIVKRTINSWGSGKYNIEENREFHEAALLKLDINKAITNLDWRPTLSLDDSIGYTVDWYKNYNEGNISVYEFTKAQIVNYTNKARALKLKWSK